MNLKSGVANFLCCSDAEQGYDKTKRLDHKQCREYKQPVVIAINAHNSMVCYIDTFSLVQQIPQLVVCSKSEFTVKLFGKVFSAQGMQLKE